MSEKGAAALLAMGFFATACAPTAPRGPEAPIADMQTILDSTKLGEDGKYAEDGTLWVRGMFYKGGRPVDALINVKLAESESEKRRRYEIALTPDLFGAITSIPMWDSGFATIRIPADKVKTEHIRFSKDDVRAIVTKSPRSAGLTLCYYGEQILDGGIRFAICHIQEKEIYIGFADFQEKDRAAVNSLGGAVPGRD